ncbi:TetR/AcrR family transcriptional regulator [Novosphingobium profundi]|uniref:TetR/AcrR family transcriptional regulator n=1 Tax=Novosphingobium profundi TaxID=1774954 RepID=UPI001CFE60E7|nr:TetR/AcrR family transcriptional regulator [Novosphingobium profundi]
MPDAAASPFDARTPRRRGYAKGAAKREAILRGVMELMNREGYTRQSLRDIGEALGMEPAHILYYFANREDLLQSVIALWDSDSIPSLRETGTRAAPPSLDLFVEAVSRNVGAPGMGHLFLAFAAEAVDPEHSAHAFFKQRVDRVQHDLAQAICAGQACGKLRAGLDPDQSARHLMALADGLQLQAMLQARGDVIADLRAAINALAA